MRRAAAKMPKPVPWSWAGPRVLPLLSGPRLDRPGEEMLHSVTGIGCVIIFGLPLGPRFVFVDRDVAERWECTVAQVETAAMENLARLAAKLQPRDAPPGSLSGRIVRVLTDRPWASSLILLPDELVRVFGHHDQVFVTPGSGTLLSLPVDMPTHAIADIAVDFEMAERWPLCLDPFVLEDRVLGWCGLADEAADRDGDGRG